MFYYIFFILNIFCFWTRDRLLSNKKKLVIKRPAKRNVIWFTPTRAKEINGIVLGTLPSSMFYKNDSLNINGIHIEINPIMLYLVLYVVIGSLTSPFTWSDTAKNGSAFNYYPDTSKDRSKNIISGVNFSFLGSTEMNYYSGVTVSSVATIGKSLKGISITLGQNNFYEYKGLLIAGLMNNASKGRGLQIGLINRCKDCKGVQIGLLNTLGKRTFPIFNMRL